MPGLGRVAIPLLTVIFAAASLVSAPAALGAGAPITYGGSIVYDWRVSDPSVQQADDGEITLKQTYKLDGYGPIIDPIVGSYSASIGIDVDTQSLESTGGTDTGMGESLSFDARLFPLSPLTLALGGGLRTAQSAPGGARVTTDGYNAYSRIGLNLPRRPSLMLYLSRVAQDSQPESGSGLSRERTGVNQVEMTSQYAFGRNNLVAVGVNSTSRENIDSGLNGSGFSANGRVTLRPTEKLLVIAGGDSSNNSQDVSDYARPTTTHSQGVDLRSTYYVSPQRVLRANLAGRTQDAFVKGTSTQSETTQGSVELSGVLAPGINFAGILLGEGIAQSSDTGSKQESFEEAKVTGSFQVSTTRLKRGTATAKTEITQTTTDGTSYTPVLQGRGRFETQINPVLTGIVEISAGVPVGEASLAKDIKNQQSVFGQLGLVNINASRLTVGYRISSYSYVSPANDRDESAATASWSYSPLSYLTLVGEYQRGRTEMPNEPSRQETNGLSANIQYRPLPELNLTFEVARQEISKTEDATPTTRAFEDSYTLRAEYQFYAVKFTAEALFANTEYSEDVAADQPRGRRYVIRAGAERYF